MVEDCETVWLSTSCAQSCSDVVGIGGVDAFAAAVDEAENGICADHPSCRPPVPPCVPPAPVVCVDGACVEVDRELQDRRITHTAEDGAAQHVHGVQRVAGREEVEGTV